jgi:hypothetical protein
VKSNSIKKQVMSNHTFNTKGKDRITSALGNTYAPKVYQYMVSIGELKPTTVPKKRVSKLTYIRQVVNGMVNSKLYYDNICELVLKEEARTKKFKTFQA